MACVHQSHPQAAPVDAMASADMPDSHPVIRLPVPMLQARIAEPGTRLALPRDLKGPFCISA